MSDRHQHTRVFRSLDETVGRDRALCRMIPAKQGFEAQDAPGFKFDNRLIVNAELPLGESGAQVGFELQAAYGPRVHGFIEHLAARAAKRFGPPHGDVRVLQYVFRTAVRFGAEGDADAYCRAHFARFD